MRVWPAYLHVLWKQKHTGRYMEIKFGGEQRNSVRSSKFTFIAGVLWSAWNQVFQMLRRNRLRLALIFRVYYLYRSGEQIKRRLWNLVNFKLKKKATTTKNVTQECANKSIGVWWLRLMHFFNRAWGWEAWKHNFDWSESDLVDPCSAGEI